MAIAPAQLQFDGFYKYSEIADENEGIYWFTLDNVGARYFEPANHQLQTDPGSPFRRTLTAQRRLGKEHMVLRGLIKKTIDEAGTRTELLSDETAFFDCLRDDFNLEVPEIVNLWPALQQRHEELFGTQK